MSIESSGFVASFNLQPSWTARRRRVGFGLCPALATCASLLLGCGERGAEDAASGVGSDPGTSSSGADTSSGQGGTGTGSPVGTTNGMASSGSSDDPSAIGSNDTSGDDDTASQSAPDDGNSGSSGASNEGAGGSGSAPDDAGDGAPSEQDSEPPTDDADGTADDSTADDGSADDGSADDGSADDGSADDGTADDDSAADDEIALPPGDGGGSSDDSPGTADDSEAPDGGDDDTEPDAGEDPSAEAGLDVFGIRELYPSAPSRGRWTSEHWGAGEAYEIESRSDDNDPSGLSGMRGTGSLFVTGDGQLILSGSEPRIYVYPGDAGPWRDVEVTVYYQRVTDDDTAWGGLVIGARSGVEGHGDTPCDAHTYYSRMRHDGETDFEKELKHPASSTGNRVSEDELWPPSGDVPRETWIGWKYVIYNTPDQAAVKLEAYRDLTGGADGGDWELVNEDLDDGGWGVETDCDEHSPMGGESTLIRLEGGVTFIRNTGVEEARYRWLTIREISP